MNQLDTADHLASAFVVMDSTGALITNQRFMPFGEVRTDVGTQLTDPAADGFTDFGFTGQRAYQGFGLMDYHARFYSPSLGRFIQPDTVIPDLGNSQACNRYSYVMNSPIMYVDPSGHFPDEPPGDEPCLDGFCDSVIHPLIDSLLGVQGIDPDTLKEQSASGKPNIHVCGIVQGFNTCIVIFLPEDLMKGENTHNGDLAGYIVNINEMIYAFGEYLTKMAKEAGYKKGAQFGARVFPVLSTIFAGFDLASEELDCWESNECYYDSPGEGLPNMLVFANQDVVVTGGDLVFGTLGTPAVDFATTSVSILHQAGRDLDVIPNMVNIGASIHSPDSEWIFTIYYLIYLQ